MPNSVPDTMNVIEIAEFGGPDVLKPAKRPVPKPGPGEVLIEVVAAGINRPDMLQRQGGYRPPPGASDIPGLEIAGRIAALGPDVSGWKIGDQACALVAGGGYAEYCTAPAPQCLPFPRGMDAIKTGAIPETFFTVWTNVFDRGRLKSGETFLVHGGSSGIGTTAIQLAHAFGARVFTTAGSAEKCAACVKLGAERAINHKTEDFVAILQEATKQKGVDVILDMVGGPYINRNLQVLAMEGRLVQIAFLQGSKAEIDVGALMMKRQTLTGSTLRPRSVAEKGTIAKSLREKVWPLLDSGEVAPVMFKTFPLAEAAAAHHLMESSNHIGKIVLVTGRG
jgi:putative PIG3 family NAD(P)H quinone oxidoreductase